MSRHSLSTIKFLHEGSAALELLFRQPEAKGAWWLWMKKFNDEHSATAACNHGVAFVGYFAICLGASKRLFDRMKNLSAANGHHCPCPHCKVQVAGLAFCIGHQHRTRS